MSIDKKLNPEDDWKYTGPLLATDAIIEYSSGKEQGIVLIERKYFPQKIALPGGMAECGYTLEQNAIKESKEETGLKVRHLYKNPFMVNSHPLRDPRGHIVSLTYIVQGEGIIKPDEKEDAKRAWFCSYDELKNMLGKDLFAFDHEMIIKKYLEHKKIIS